MVRKLLRVVAALGAVGAAVGEEWSWPCAAGQPGVTLPFCDAGLTTQQRVQDLVGRLTVDEMASLLVNTAASVPRLGLPAYQWWSEGLHGVAFSPGVHFRSPTPAATSFPQVCTTAAAWNRTLWRGVGEVVSTEGRAMNNAGNAGLSYWAPNLNIVRDPRWGRAQETPGEDPFLTAAYVQEVVEGMQGGGGAGGPLKVSACCKHFDAYSLERWEGMDRHHFNAVVGVRDLYDTYLPGFQACVANAGASGIMCSYNAVNGVPSCVNAPFQTTIARGAWGFQGYITSDCGALDDVYANHDYVTTPDQTVLSALIAGTDSNCGSVYSNFTAGAVSSGMVAPGLLRGALTHLFTVQWRLGMWDDPATQPLRHIPPSVVASPPHSALALQAAQEGLVLVKNSGGALPLLRGSLASLAVVGPHANATTVLQGSYFGQAPSVVSPLAGLEAAFPSAAIQHVQGCGVLDPVHGGTAAASAAAATANATVIVGGLNGEVEAEGRDRLSLAWPAAQSDFIAGVAAAAAGPVVLVVVSGGPIDLSPQLANPNISAIVWVGYPGQAAGTAIAQVVSGAVNPSGRLTTTVYPAEYAETVSMLNMNMRPQGAFPGRTHRFYTGPVVLPFGHGLSYSTWTVSSIAITVPTAWASPGGQVSAQALSGWLKAQSTEEYGAVFAPSMQTAPLVATVTVQVRNTGSVAGAWSGLLMGAPPGAGTAGTPLSTLLQFDKLWLEAGASGTFTLPLHARQLTHITAGGQRVVSAGQHTLSIVQGGDSATTSLSVE